MNIEPSLIKNFVFGDDGGRVEFSSSGLITAVQLILPRGAQKEQKHHAKGYRGLSGQILPKPIGVAIVSPNVFQAANNLDLYDADRCNGETFVVRGDEKLTAFLELESAIRSRN